MSQSQVERLCEVMSRLRAPGGCPWDREQTHASLSPYLIEECAELLEAIDRSDFPHMCEELGDVLLQVVFHAQIAEDAGHFKLEDVARGIADKLVRRHPHVFGEGKLETSGEVLTQWDQIKRAEKLAKGQIAVDAPEPFVKEAPPALPALRRAFDIYKLLAKKDALPAASSLHDAVAIEQTAAGLDEANAGRRLFELAAACRRTGIDPEAALRKHTLAVIDAAESAHAKSSGRAT